MNTAITCPSMQRASGEVVTALPRFTTFICTLLATVAAVANAQGQGTASELGDLSIEELMNESITSVAKKEQRIADAPAAVYVLTAEDILRAGHANIPEALRMVPGLSVARLDSHAWVITSRGFAAQYAGKLLVLIDGRTVYDPFFSGVFWNLQDLMLEDLERIEVIRGPGATLWGANAVNGVINIITKRASDTQGGLVTAAGGTHGGGAAVRYGGDVGNVQYRAYAKYDDGSEFEYSDGRDAQDSWRMRRAGFRVDGQSSETEHFTVQGDLYNGEQAVLSALTSLTPPYMQVLADEERVSGANLLGRWHSRAQHSSWSAQLYFDRTESEAAMLGIKRDIIDLELQREFEVGARQTLVLGAGYRLAQADYEDSFFLTYPVESDSRGLANAFFQDEIALRPDRLSLTVGTKLEHNEVTGLEVQPSVRILWTPTANQSAWASVSRAVRTPNPLETDLRIHYAVFDPDAGGSLPPNVFALVPNPDLESEELIAYEAGFRAQPHDSVYLDVAAFVNVYDRLVGSRDAGVSVETSPAPHVVIASRAANALRGETYGIEFGPSWQVTDSWRLAGAYTWLHMDLRADTAGQFVDADEGDSPRHQLHLRSFKQWPHGLSFDAAIYYVDELPNQQISSYLRVDARLGWQPTDALDLSIAGTNLFDSRHAEFLSFAVEPVEVRRSVQAKLTWRF